MKIIVTGCAGFIGSHLCLELVNKGYEVIGIDNLSSGKRENINNEIDFLELDLRDKSLYERIPQNDVLAVFHLAAQSGGDKSFDDPAFDLDSNTMTTLHLLNHFRDSEIHFIFASSMATYGEASGWVDEKSKQSPISYYGLSKLTSEKYLKICSENSKIKYTALRIFNAYGPGQDLTNLHQGIVSIFLGQAVQNGEIIVKGSPNRLRDFVHIDDVTQLMCLTLNNPKAYNDTFNLASGRPEKIGTLVNEILKRLPFEVNVKYKGSTRGDIKSIKGKINKARKLLGYSPNFKLKEGLVDTIEYALNFRKTRLPNKTITPPSPPITSSHA